MLTPVRIGWLLLAGLSAALSVFVAYEPMWQITPCELGVYLYNGIGNRAECNESILAHFGPCVLFVLAIPVTLCLGPAVVPTKPITWIAAALLLACRFVTFSTSTMLTISGYYTPIALVAVVMAVSHGRLIRMQSRVVLG